MLHKPKSRVSHVDVSVKLYQYPQIARKNLKFPYKFHLCSGGVPDLPIELILSRARVGRLPTADGNLR